MVALYSSATRLSFFKFVSVLRRRDKAIGLVSGGSGLSSFQGTATRYLPFSYSRESFHLSLFFGEYKSVFAVRA